MSTYKKIPLIYFIVGSCWVALSDRVVHFIAPTLSHATQFQTLKGCFFITTTTALIWVLVRRHSRKLEAATREREQLYYKTVESAHHILLNYLNKMQFVTLEAERFEDFDRNILQVSVDATDDAAEALHRLSHLPKPSTMRVHKVAYKGVVHPSDRDLEM